jgi:hypothetical protein
MNPNTWAIPLSVGVLAGIFVFLEAGYRLACRNRSQSAATYEGIGALEAAVFGLLGLLLAFSFSGATSRLDARRQLIVEEANAIGTAYLRVDLFDAADQPELRRMFREYLEARLRVYQALPNLDAAEQALQQASGMQMKIWSKAISASRADSTQNIARVVLPALNSMIDVTTSRAVASQTHLPGLILSLLVVVALLSALLAGYAMAKRGARSWLHMAVFALSVTATIYAVIDLDYPRAGWIRLDAADNELAKLRDSIRP